MFHGLKNLMETAVDLELKSIAQELNNGAALVLKPTHNNYCRDFIFVPYAIGFEEKSNVNDGV